MAHNKDSGTARPDKVIEFVPASGIQMIGRFVHQDNFGRMYLYARQIYFCLFATTQRIHRLVQPDMLQSPKRKSGQASFFDIPVIIQNRKVLYRGISGNDSMQCLDFSLNLQGLHYGQFIVLPEMLGHIIGFGGTNDFTRGGLQATFHNPQ